MREPDVAFVHRDRIPDTGIPDGYWSGPADLVIEIRSPGDREGEIETKVADNLARGVRMIWVVDPNKQTATVHRPAARPTLFALDDVLDGVNVLPAFTCAVKHLLAVARR